MENCDTDFVTFCCECALNVIKGTVGINLKELCPYKKQLRLLGRVNTIKKRKKIGVTKRPETFEFDISSLISLFDRPMFVTKTRLIVIPYFTHNRRIKRYKFSKTQKLRKKQSFILFQKKKFTETSPQDKMTNKIILKSLDMLRAAQKPKLENV